MSTERMPCCGKRLKTHENTDGSGNRPRPGDVSVCANCASILWFDDQCRLRLPTARDMLTLTDDEVVRLAAAQNQVRAGGLQA